MSVTVCGLLTVNVNTLASSAKPVYWVTTLLGALWCCAVAFGYTLLPSFGGASPLDRIGELAWACAWLAAISACAWSYGAFIPISNTLNLSPTERALLQVGIGYGALSLAVLALGVLGLLYAPLFAAAVLAGALPAFFALLRGEGGRTTETSRHRAGRLKSLSVPLCLRLRGKNALLLVIAIQLAYLLVGFALVPPTAYDALAYHLGLPKLFIAAHRIYYVPFVVHANWPELAEMISLLGLLLRSEMLVNLLSLALSLLGGAAIYLLGRRLVSAGGALLGCAIYASAPAIRDLAGIPMVEPALASYSALATLCLALWLRERHSGWLMLSAAFGGFAASVKLTGLATPLLLGALFLAWSVVRRERLWPTLLLATRYGAIVALLVLPWYAKSALYTGNPIWPFFNTLLPSRNWDSFGAQAHDAYLHITNLPPTPLNFLRSLWYVATDPGRYGGFALGPLTLLAVPPVLARVLLSPSFRTRAGALVLFCALYYCQWFLLSQQTRFLAPLLPVLALLAGDTYAWMWQGFARAPRWLAASVATSLLLLILPLFAAPEQQRWRDGAAYLAGQLGRDDYLARYVPSEPLYRYANAALPSNALVLLLFENRGYLLDRDYVWANPVSQRIIKFEQYSDVAALAADLCQRRFTHLLYYDAFAVPDDFLPNGAHISALQRQLVHQYAKPLYEMSDKAGVYALQCKDAGGASFVPR